MKIINDLLKVNGKYSFKRVTALYVLHVAIVYVFLPVLFPKFPILEFVVMSFVGYSAGMVGMTVWQKKLLNKDEDETVG